MTDGAPDFLAEQFEEHRAQLRAVAYRMLGSLSEADDAVQEAWLRLSRTDADEIENLGGWLTTVVARVCLNMLRSRDDAAREDPLGTCASRTRSSTAIDGADPEHEALLADSVGLALLVVLEKLAPAERLAFVLHDMFAVPFDEIAPDRRALARRRPPARQPRPAPGAGRGARARTRTSPASARWSTPSSPPRARATSTALVAVLDPDVVLRADARRRPPARASSAAPRTSRPGAHVRGPRAVRAPGADQRRGRAWS